MEMIFPLVFSTVRPDSVTFQPVNVTAVRISWNANSTLPTTLSHITVSNVTGAVMGESSLVLPAATTSATVILEDILGLDDEIDEYQHIFTLYQITFNGVRGFGATLTFTFGKQHNKQYDKIQKKDFIKQCSLQWEGNGT